MTDSKRIAVGTGLWLALISGLYFWLDFDWSPFLNERRPPSQRKLNVAYIPVT